ncbi:hypothetical protein AOLI_G00173220 [Acnodon oligacanthus]
MFIWHQQYFYTGVTSEINFPEFSVVGLVDGDQFVYYDSNIRKKSPKTEWMEKSVGVHTWQRIFDCELHEDGTKRGYHQEAYDEEDFISLDLNTGT